MYLSGGQSFGGEPGGGLAYAGDGGFLLSGYLANKSFVKIERKSVSAQSNYSKTTGMAVRMSAAEAPASIVKAPGLTTQPWLSLS